MATKSATAGVRQAARKVAAPFWKAVKTSGLDRFFVERMLRALLRRFRTDRFARVRQGGLHGDARAELARVFIDLDVTPGPLTGPNAAFQLADRIVASWMPTPREQAEGSRRALRSGVEGLAGLPLEVVLGGPGQGKSTVGRFLVLIHASILLLTAPFEGITPPADAAQMEALLGGLSAEEIPLPQALRLPVWIELRELADALLREEPGDSDPLTAMLRWYATDELREGADVTSLEAALVALPWVAVFDGFDEVPPARARTLVGACIAGARSRFASADGRVIATSRPQSYDREVFGDNLVERTLLPLTPERAALYAQRFITSLYPEEDAERATLLTNLRRALSDQKTAELMKNPLLVTIMGSIVMHHGEPTTRRWTLFEEYYDTLYRRETERGTYASATLRENAPLIGAIHRHVGMSLQARSENSEGVSALMPEHELRAVMRHHLLVNHDEDEASRLTDEILRAAEQRLVLLVQAQEGMYGFELRSFQEFTAAWQVVSLDDTQTDALLRRLAPLSTWRNVVLFAIGQQYAEGLPLAANRSIDLCATLDSASDRTGRIALPGARLALDILADAPYGKATRPRDQLVSEALKLLRIPATRIHHALGEHLGSLARERLMDALEDALGDARRSEAAWLTLLIVPEDDRTRELAERHWPAGHEDERRIVRAHARPLWQGFMPVRSTNRWLSTKVVGDPTLTSPRELWILLTQDHRPGMPISYGPVVRTAFHADHYTQFGWPVGSSGQWMAATTEDPARIPESGEWAIVRASASLREEPTASRLADILEDLASGWEERYRWYWPANAAWTLLTCVMAAQSASDLKLIAARLRRDELGDGPRWREIEREGWSDGQDRIAALAASPDPLRAMLVEGLIPPFDDGRGSAISEWSVGSLALSRLRELDRLRRESAAAWVQKMISQMILHLLDACPISSDAAAEEHHLSAGELIELVDTAETVMSAAWLELLSPTSAASEMLAVLSQTTAPIVAARGLRPPLPLQSLARSLCDALARAPDSQRVQRALVVVLRLEAARGRAGELTADPLGDGIDTWLLRFAAGRATSVDAPTLARRLVEANDAWALLSSLRMLAAHTPSRDLVLPVVEALLALPDVDSSLRSAAVEFIADQLANAPSGLASPESWKAAGLPAPPPMPHRSEPPELPSSPVTLVEINNLRAFPQRFEVPVPASAGPGQWMVFLGENATGKTTLLRAIAMALASPADAAAVPSNLEGPLRRDAARDGLVRVRLADGRELTTTITGPAGEERVVVAPEQPTRPWVVGYGCRRGSAISGTDMDNAFAPFRDLDNLFDRSRGVIRASGWLKELQRLAKNNGARSRMVFEAAREALRKVLLGAENVRVENEVLVDFEDRRQVPLALLSDGYLTTAGWIVDLMARWLKRNEGRRTVDDRFCSVMEGVVLLDEIDLHLHPRWQERVIEDVRTLFPRMTFIATTHHPLTLRGAREGEVFILGDHDGSGSITALQRDIPAGTRVDELLTGEWFNRPSAIVDKETRALLDEHQQLVLGGAKAGEPRRKALEKELRKRLGRYADTSLERLAATIVARHLDGSLPEPSAQKREEVRAKVAEILRRRDAKRG